MHTLILHTNVILVVVGVRPVAVAMGMDLGMIVVHGDHADDAATDDGDAAGDDAGDGDDMLMLTLMVMMMMVSMR